LKNFDPWPVTSDENCTGLRTGSLARTFSKIIFRSIRAADAGRGRRGGEFEDNVGHLARAAMAPQGFLESAEV
jgi:hypothetical protein